jgi:hypothetical protein
MLQRAFLFLALLLVAGPVWSAPARSAVPGLNWSGVLSIGVPRWQSSRFTLNNTALRSGDSFSDLSAGQMAIKMQITKMVLPTYGMWAVSLGCGQDRAILEDYQARPSVGGSEQATTAIYRAALDRQHLDVALQVTPWVTTYLRANLRGGYHFSQTRVSQQLADGRIADDFNFSSQGTFQEFGFEIGPASAFVYASVYLTQQRTAKLRNFMDQPVDLNGYSYFVGLGRYSF